MFLDSIYQYIFSDSEFTLILQLIPPFAYAHVIGAYFGVYLLILGWINSFKRKLSNYAMHYLYNCNINNIINYWYFNINYYSK